MTPSPTPVVATASPSLPPTAEPTPTPLPVEVVRWHTAGESIYVELFNPNQDLGLLRASFSIAVIAEDDSVFTVLGEAGLPGTPVSTIYQLPPNGTYGLEDFLPRRPPPIKALEFSMPSHQWMDWHEVNPPAVEVIGPSLRTSFGYPDVTGRVELAPDAEGPFNVWIMAFVERGEAFVVASGAAECVEAGQRQAFQVGTFETFRRGSLTKVAAYTTTVPGVRGSDGLDRPPGCG